MKTLTLFKKHTKLCFIADFIKAPKIPKAFCCFMNPYNSSGILHLLATIEVTVVPCCRRITSSLASFYSFLYRLLYTLLCSLLHSLFIASCIASGIASCIASGIACCIACCIASFYSLFIASCVVSCIASS